MRSTIALGLFTLAGLSAAQKTYTIDPNSVPKSTRDYWCQMEKTQCPLICLQQPGVTSSALISNDCNPDDLTYSCVCENNVSPNVTMYTQTIPYFVCTEWGNQCVSACGDNACADKCRADNQCGAADPYKGNATASASASASASSAASQTSGSTASSTAIAPAFGEPSSKPSNNGAATFTGFGASYGAVVTVLGVLAGVALL